jgi:hypothetical protein
MDGELSSLKKDSVDYAINIEIQDFSELVDQLEAIMHPGLYIRNDRDLLRHIDLIGGVNTVQMYLKAKDGITGNHQENENAVAVNINLSKGSSDWICVGGDENIDRYQKLMLRKYGYDVRLKWGMTLPNPRFLIAHQIKTSFFC